MVSEEQIESLVEELRVMMATSRVSMGTRTGQYEKLCTLAGVEPSLFSWNEVVVMIEQKLMPQPSRTVTLSDYAEAMRSRVSDLEARLRDQDQDTVTESADPETKVFRAVSDLHLLGIVVKDGGYGSVSSMIKDAADLLVKELPCSPGCRGVTAFATEVPAGFVHVKRCDACDKFESNEEAAESITKHVFHYCTDCGRVSLSPCSETALGGHIIRQHRDNVVVVITEAAAREAGLTTGRG